jgi:pSer/pThr/pTyr-binding forkhead associated (FHA) protein
VDLAFDDPLISRKHAALEVYSRDYVFLRDLASTNGTFVNDHMVTQVKLRPGDTIRVGRIVLQYWFGPDAATVSRNGAQKEEE